MRFGLFFQLPVGADQTVGERYRDTLAQVEAADRLGFSSAWFAEAHFTPRFSTTPAPLVMLSHLAARTRRIRLGTAATILPLHHPVRLAEEAAMVDLLSNGRLDLGVGRGSFPIQFEGYGLDRRDVDARFEDTLATVKALLAHAPSPRQLNGEPSSGPPIIPRPVQPSGPPIWVVANGPRTGRFAGRAGYGAIISAITQPMPDRFAAHARCFRSHAHATQPLAAVLFVYPGAGASDVKTRLALSLRSYFGVLGASVPYAAVDGRMGFLGTPARIVDGVGKLVEGTPLDELICWINPGGRVSHDAVIEALEVLASDVFPHLSRESHVEATTELQGAA